mmetsp:Transcript_10770/g.25737  ORF Transcript_10770/g.25737 Transcript_10770/m.25737 type:complete len:234 (-) Transcript_10770:3275-3976(-)
MVEARPAASAILRNALPGVCSNFLGESNSESTPWSSTITKSESMIVSSRCAIASTVCLLNCSAIMVCMLASAPRSMDAVASSSMRIAGSRNRARPIQRSWRWPTDRLSPPSAQSSCSLFGNPLTKSLRRTRSRACQMTSSSLIAPKGSRLYLRSPENTTGSCGMSPIRDRRVRSPTLAVSIPSIKIPPSRGSSTRSIDNIIVLFPHPVLPQTPTFCPAPIVKDNDLRMVGPSR